MERRLSEDDRIGRRRFIRTVGLGLAGVLAERFSARDEYPSLESDQRDVLDEERQPMAPEMDQGYAEDEQAVSPEIFHENDSDLLRREMGIALVVGKDSIYEIFRAKGGIGGRAFREALNREKASIFENERVHLFKTKFNNNEVLIKKYLSPVEKSWEKYAVSIQRASQEHDVPPWVLAGVLGVESGGDTNAHNKGSGAHGPMQFTEKTAQSLGLVVDAEIGVDERTDITKSIDATARYLKTLYGIFGQWSLALTAYAGGVGKLGRRVRSLYPALRDMNRLYPKQVSEAGVNILTLYSSMFHGLGRKYHSVQYPLWVEAMAPLVQDALKRGAEERPVNTVARQ